MSGFEVTDEARQLMSSFGVAIRIPVAWGEMDSFGHVNNIIYFRYFESARMEYFQHVRFLDEMEEGGVGPILASTSCRFKRPLGFPDEVLVGARARDLEEDRFTMDYRVLSLADEAVAAEGEGLIVSYDYRKKEKAPIPDAVRRAIEELESDPL